VSLQSAPPPVVRREQFSLAALGLMILWSLLGRSVGAQEMASRTELLERVVAVVDERPLLLSDVRALAKVRSLAPEGALREAIDERLMYAEASRLVQAEVKPEQVDAALAALLAKNPALRAAVPEPDLRRLVRKQLAVLRYVEFRFRPQVKVSDEDVRRVWEREEGPAGLALEDALELIRSRLERQALDEKIESWVEELRSRADVRYVGGALPSEL
jgi:hypothetical protein